MDVKFKNQFLFPVRIQRLAANGAPDPDHVYSIAPDGDKSIDGADAGDRWLVTLDYSGGQITTITVGSDDTIKLDETLLPTEASLGAPPAPTASNPVPGDSAPLVVAQGKDAKGNVLTREIWWHLTSQTISLPPGGSQMWSVSVTEGVEQSKTIVKNVASELGLDASAGWFGISSSISTSLSKSSSTTQNITLSDSTTTSSQTTMSNPRLDADMTARMWQVQERYTFWDPKHSKVVVTFTNDTNQVDSVTTFRTATSTSSTVARMQV